MLQSIGWLSTDVSELHIGSIFNGLVPKKKTRKMGSPETSALNQPTLRYIPENDRIQVNHSENLRSFKIPFVYGFVTEVWNAQRS
jgi:hypothetical protein